MSNSQTAISEQKRKSSVLIWSGLVWIRTEVGVESLPFWLTENDKWHYYLAANDTRSISVIFQGIYIYYKVDFQPRGIGSMLQMLVLTGGERRPLDNCGHAGLCDLMPHPCLHGSVVTPSVSALSRLLLIGLRIPGKISRRLRSRAAQVTGEMALLTGPGDCLSL